MDIPPNVPPAPLNRREMLRQAGGSLLGLAALSSPLAATSVAAVSPGGNEKPPANRFPQMMQEWWVERVAAISRASAARRGAVRTRAEAEAYAQDITAKVRACFGPQPERTPLNARTARTTDRGAYRIEHVIFESRPGFLVTGNLYLPAERTKPAPAVLGKCGHYDIGKAAARYQAYAQGLVRQGYVVFLIDPLGQGERSQYVDAEFKTALKLGTTQHFHAGNQQTLVGEFLGAWRVWDGIRALDYLLTRPEVDPARVGVTGHSGGGTLTTWLCGVEPRWAMAAPACAVTTWLHTLENEIDADPEQYPPGALGRGLDLPDFLVPFAPRPLLLLGEEKDFFDVRGLEEAARRLEKHYGLLNAPENLGLHIAPGYHDYSPENYREMFRWFNRATGMPGAASLPEPVTEPEATLWCTPRGQVAELKSRTVFSFTREKSLAQAQARRSLTGDALAVAVTAALRMPERTGVPPYRILRPLRSTAYPTPHVASYAVETEPKIFAVVYRLHHEDQKMELVTRPPRAAGRALLYVSHLSADAELRREPLVRELIAAEPDATVFACDLRGGGESQPVVGGLPFHGAGTSDYLHAGHGLMFDYPVPGQRTYDLLRVLDWLRAAGHTEVHLCGHGRGAIPATFAALLSSLVTQVTLKRALTSYAAVAETEAYQCPLSLMLPGVLASFDLPDCYRALQAKRLSAIEAWDPSTALPV